jgi:tRNA threonylcarbamoyladenosine biosynthesis protein TsaE
MKSLEITTKNPAETIELGRKIGSLLKGGEVFAIEGPLGSGKTHLIKGIVAGANGGLCDHVNSPTFVLVNEYPGKLDVFHIDAYRLETTSEFELLGFDDFLYPTSVILIEWADKVHAILDSMNCISLTLDYDSKDLRSVCLTNAPPYLADL